MPEYRRIFQPGGTFFFTVVTFERKPIFNSPAARKLLGESFRSVKEKYPFTMDAICLLPDHLHTIWTMPPNESNYSIRWSAIKAFFTHGFIKSPKSPEELTPSQLKRREGAVWQRRFWEHMIRDEIDLENHIYYIHFNPVKHGLVHNVDEWEWSTFHKYVDLGWYPGESKNLPTSKDLGISDEWD